MKKIFTQIENPNLQVVDSSTGEIISAVKTIKAESLDDFIMVFLNGIRYLYDLEGLELKLLMCCWKHSIYSDGHQGNILLNDNEFKNEVSQEGLKMSPSTIDVYISKLSKKKLLIRISKGKYMLNPEYFFRGRLTDRSKLKINLQYQ